MATLPEHSRQNRRIQINQAGAWGTTLRVVDQDGKVLRSWSADGGWKVAEARS